jgi:hypothetical protein
MDETIKQKPCHDKTRLAVFEQDGSGDYKIAGIEVYGGEGLEIVHVVNIEGPLPEIIDEPEEYLDSGFQADVVLDFLRHPDLSDYLVALCRDRGLPVISAGKRIEGAICPFTCCGLGRSKGLGAYGRRFGLPRYVLEVRRGRIAEMEAIRGASCGATWQVIPRMIGTPIDEAVAKIGREVQFACLTDPSAFDPVTGKSALHFAGEVHQKALEQAIREALSR